MGDQATCLQAKPRNPQQAGDRGDWNIVESIAEAAFDEGKHQSRPERGDKSHITSFNPDEQADRNRDRGESKTSSGRLVAPNDRPSNTIESGADYRRGRVGDGKYKSRIRDCTWMLPAEQDRQEQPGRKNERTYRHPMDAVDAA